MRSMMPFADRMAQNSSLDVKTIGFNKGFAPPDLENVGLAEVFKRKVLPNRSFGGVEAPKPRNLRGFPYRESTKPTLRQAMQDE